MISVVDTSTLNVVYLPDSNNIRADVAEDETVWPQTEGLLLSFGTSTVGENIASHNQVIKRKIADRRKKRLTVLLRPTRIGSMTRF